MIATILSPKPRSAGLFARQAAPRAITASASIHMIVRSCMRRARRIRSHAEIAAVAIHLDFTLLEAALPGAVYEEHPEAQRNHKCTSLDTKGS